MNARPLILCGLSFAFPLLASAEIYLSLENEVPAEYDSWIPIKSIQFGISMPVEGSRSTSGSTTSGLANFSDIVLKKNPDASSLDFFSQTCGGDILNSATLHFTQSTAQGKILPYYKVKLSWSVITQFGLSTGNGVPTEETISLNYGKIEARAAQLDSGGLPTARETVATYDVILNTGQSGEEGPLNTAPSIQSIGDLSTSEDTPLTHSFTVSDAETLASNLILSKTSSNATLLPASQISFGGSGANRTVTFSPLPDQYGTATVTLSVSDGGKSASTQFVLSVVSANDAPVITAPATLTLISGTPTPLTGISLGDIDAGSLPLRLTAGVTQGTLHTNTSVADLSVFGNGFSDLTLEAPLSSLNQLLDSPQGLIYQNYPAFSGTDTLTLNISDLGSSGSGGVKTYQAQIALKVFASLYDEWKSIQFESSLENPDAEESGWGSNADPDLDGIPNLLEYALRLNPILPDAGSGPKLATQTLSGNTYHAITLERRIDPSIEVYVEVSSDLQANSWSSDSSEIQQTASSALDGVQQIVFRDQKSISDAPNRYYRVVARLRP